MARGFRIGYPRAVRVSGDFGTYTNTGTAASLLKGYRSTADQGTYSVSGQLATLTFDGSGSQPPADPGTITQLGSATLSAHLTQVRQNLGPITGENETQANTRMNAISGILAWCGAAIRANRYYCLAISGGHGDSQDDGFYEFDLNTNAWVYPPRVWPSASGSSTDSITGGEYTGLGQNRPASQHSYNHIVAWNNDIIQANGYAIGHVATGSLQAHWWKESTGVWERIGTANGGASAAAGNCFIDTARNRLVRIQTTYNTNTVDTLSLSSPTSSTAWTVTSFSAFNVISGTGPDYYIGINYHKDLDCFVAVCPQSFSPRNRIFVMAAGNISAGWTAVDAGGIVPPQTGYSFPEYIDPLGIFAITNDNDNNTLYYLSPPSSGVITDPWTWSSEDFTGTASAWAITGPAAYAQSRCRFSDTHRGLLILKGPSAPMEKWVPAALAAYYDWVDRSTESGVVAAYRFSDTPANGGDWKWGSPSASPKTTVFAMNDASYSSRRVLDSSVKPAGSKKSLRFDIPTNSGEAADAWRISLDNYADQFGAGSEFWFVFRARFNSAYCATAFQSSGGGLTGAKVAMVSAGMQRPFVYEQQDNFRQYAGYENPGATTFNASTNIMQAARIDSDGELVFRLRTTSSGTSSTANGPVGTTFQQPELYSSKAFDNLLTSGSGAFANKFTHRNGGGESSPFTGATGWFTSGPEVWDDHTQAFKIVADEWMSFAIRVTLGTWQSSASNSLGPNRQGFANSSFALYGARFGDSSWTLIHRRTGMAAVSIPQGANNTLGGAEGVQKFGQFGLTTFMTTKLSTQVHGTASMWVDQIIIKSGATPPAVPAY